MTHAGDPVGEADAEHDQHQAEHGNLATIMSTSLSTCQHVIMSACQHVNMSTCQLSTYCHSHRQGAEDLRLELGPVHHAPAVDSGVMSGVFYHIVPTNERVGHHSNHRTFSQKLINSIN